MAGTQSGVTGVADFNFNAPKEIITGMVVGGSDSNFV